MVRRHPKFKCVGSEELGSRNKRERDYKKMPLKR